MEARPTLSIILCVHNDWAQLKSCLASLRSQTQAPAFEVVLVDDGSIHSVPDEIRDFDSALSIRYLCQQNAGLAAARNTGIRAATGDVFVFTDCDCILDTNCLYNLWTCMLSYPQDNCFQLHLEGNRDHLVGRAEELRLSSIQAQTLANSGHIRYLNTAGCAIRKSATAKTGTVFDPRAVRAQDSLLLADLINKGQCPRFVRGAIVKHDVRLRIGQYMWKALRTGYVEGKTFAIIRDLGISIRVGAAGRVRVLLTMLKHSLRNSLGLSPFVIITARQCLNHIGAILYRWTNRGVNNIPFRSGLS